MQFSMHWSSVGECQRGAGALEADGTPDRQRVHVSGAGVTSTLQREVISTIVTVMEVRFVYRLAGMGVFLGCHWAV